MLLKRICYQAKFIAFSLRGLLPRRLLERLFLALAIVAAICGVMIIALVCSSVLMRHLVQAPFRFTEELVGLLMTAAFFLSLPLVTYRAQHVRVQILVSLLSPVMKRIVTAFAAVLGIVFTLWFFMLCLPWFEFAYQREIKTEVGRLLMYPWMALLPLSMVLTALAFACRLLPNDIERTTQPRSETSS